LPFRSQPIDAAIAPHTAGRVLGRRSANDLVAMARRRYRRIEPEEAHRAMAAGAILIDTRDSDQIRRDGTIPGALIIDRTILEWRVDPDSGATHSALGDLNASLILICSQGYSSSLAVASLLDLGAINVTDVIGGFEAWWAAGLPANPPDAEDRACGSHLNPARSRRTRIPSRPGPSL
jgi:rhodanese-related sulfurtransferase